MELLATVHWVATKESDPAQDSEQAIALVHEWSDRTFHTPSPFPTRFGE